MKLSGYGCDVSATEAAYALEVYVSRTMVGDIKAFDLCFQLERLLKGTSDKELLGEKGWGTKYNVTLFQVFCLVFMQIFHRQLWPLPDQTLWIGMDRYSKSPLHISPLLNLPLDSFHMAHLE